VKNNNRRVVVAGVGPVTTVGIGKDAYWESLVQGRSAFKRIEFSTRDMDQYRSKVAAPIDSFDLFQYVERTRHPKYLGKTSRYAIGAASLALHDAGFELGDGEVTYKNWLPAGGRIGDLGLCVNGKDASQERTITDPTLSSDEEIHR
jgi:3-oxoacyl-(acyl-carrier-protein) synthase